MLLLVVLGTLIAGGVGIFLLEVVVDGVLQDPFARFFLWAATTLFGQSPEGAAELYQRYIRNNKQERRRERCGSGDSTPRTGKRHFTVSCFSSRKSSPCRRSPCDVTGR